MHHVLWHGKRNSVSFELRSGGGNLDAEQYGGVNRIVMRLRAGGVGAPIAVDSAATDGFIKWGGETGERVVLDGALLPQTAILAGWYRVRVIAYSADHPEGIVFADYPDYILEIRDGT